MHQPNKSRIPALVKAVGCPTTKSSFPSLTLSTSPSPLHAVLSFRERFSRNAARFIFPLSPSTWSKVCTLRTRVPGTRGRACVRVPSGRNCGILGGAVSMTFLVKLSYPCCFRTPVTHVSSLASINRSESELNRYNRTYKFSMYKVYVSGLI